MAYRTSIAGLVAAVLAIGPAGGARADGAEAFVGGLLGSAIGTAITNNVQQRQQQQRVIVEKRYVAPRAPRAVNSYQREENRRVQTALNHFGFPAGPADGVMGPASRGAVMQYQAAVGFPTTGVLMDNERFFLLSSYERAVVGGPQAAPILAASGPRGLLLAYRQEQLGVAPVAAAPAMPAPVAPAPAPVAVPVAVPAAEPVPVAAVPTFMPDAPAEAASVLPGGRDSLAGLCNAVMIDVSQNMGPITPIDVALDDPDPMQVLDEQFCVARSHAIEQAKSLVEAVDGFSPAEMRAQCEAFAPTMTRFIDGLAGRPPEAVNAEVRAFLDGTGAKPAQMSGTARVCLGIGYWTDNAELALGSALVLTALGEAAYGELVGFQVMSGYGVPADCDCGLGWTSAALDALGGGAAPLVADPEGGRTEVLAYAVGALRAGDPAAPTAANAVAPTDAFALPKAP